MSTKLSTAEIAQVAAAQAQHRRVAPFHAIHNAAIRTEEE